MNLTKAHNIATISNKNEIRLILNKGQKVYTKFGLIFMFTTKADKKIKCAVLLKKNIGSAVKRNYVKRIIKYFIVQNFTAFNRYNRIIFLYNFHGNINYQELEQTYLNALKKI